MLRSLFLGCSLVALSKAPLYAMDRGEDENANHRPNRATSQRSSAPKNNPQEEEQFHQFKRGIEEKLTSCDDSRLQPLVDSLVEVWNQNQPSVTITDEAQIHKRAQQRARALDEINALMNH